MSRCCSDCITAARALLLGFCEQVSTFMRWSKLSWPTNNLSANETVTDYLRHPSCYAEAGVVFVSVRRQLNRTSWREHNVKAFS